MIIIKQEHSKTYNMAFAPSEDSDQPVHPRSMTRVFAGRSKCLILFFNYLVQPTQDIMERHQAVDHAGTERLFSGRD